MRKKLFVLCVIAIATALLLTACAGVDLTLTFEVDGEVYATVNTMGQETVKMPKDPEKEGFVFDGWYWDKDVWEKPFTANSLLETPLSENMIVYAKWKLKAETHEHAYGEWEVVTPATCTAEGLQKHACTVCGEEETEAIPKLAHNYGKWTVVTPATCTAEGLQKHACTVCGEEETEAIPKLAHNYGEWTVVTPATCIAEGLQKRVCSVCEEEESEVIPTVPHAYGEWEVVTPATCTAEGLQKRVCSVCEEEESEAIPKLAHNYGDWTVVTPATCIAEGLQKHTCTVCGEEETEVIPTVPHAYGEWEVVTPATCTAEGLQKRVCSVCEEEESEAIPKLAHNYGDWTVVTPATCTAEGLQKHACTVCGEEETEVIQKLPHTYETKHNAANHWSECSVCHETIDVTAHSFGEWIAVIPASCTAEGLQKHECACGAEQTEIIPILAHNYETKYDAEQHWQECSVCHEKINVTAHSFGEWIAVTPATCTTEGLQKHECACGAEETEVIPILAHNYETKHDATNHWSECSVCHETVNVTAHSFGEWIAVIPASCTAEGLQKHECACGAEQTEIIPILAHNYETKYDAEQHWQECSVCHEKINVTAHSFGEWIAVTPATCTTEGLQKRTCSCGADETEAIPTVPHTYNDWEVVTPATCTVAGLQKRTCSVCGTEEMEAIPKLAHTYETKTDATKHWEECSVCHETVNVTAHTFGNWTVVTPESCTVAGEKKRTCSCGEVETAVTEKLAHTYGAWEVLTAATCTAEGLEKRICSVCGEVHTEVIKKLPHTYEIKHDTANHWEVCAVCNEKINETAHTYGEWEVVTAASCTMEGEKKRVCTVCSSVHTEAIPIVPHTYATKHDETNHWEECSVCHETVNVTAHTFGNWTVVTPATCTVEGLQKRTCSVCGTEQTEAIQKLPHTYETKFDETNHWQECSVCGETSNPEAHTYENGLCTFCQRVYGTEGLTYLKITNGYAVSGIGTAGNNAEIIIPSWYEGEPVTAIYSNAFSGRRNLTKIEIPQSVTSIGDSAFSYCYSLTSIAIPNSVTSIGDSAFSYCSSLTSIAIPNSVTSIGDSAFSYCSSLTSIAIPNGVTSIGNYAFSGCNGLTIYAEAAEKPNGWDSAWNYSNSPVVWDYKNNDVADDGYIYTIQNGLRYGIKDGAAMVAKQPSNIREANIASEIIYKDTRYSVTSIGKYAFFECRGLTSIAIPNGVTSIGSYAFYNCSSLTSIAIPDSVTSIGYRSFLGCSSLTSIAIPNSVTSIGDDAFYECSSLTSIAIPDGVTSIGSSAFSYCSSLTSIVIPDSVTSIGSSAFFWCSSLTSLLIPNSVTKINAGAIIGCISLETLMVAEGNTKYHSAGNCLIETATKTLIFGCKASVIPTDGSVTSIGNHAFSGCSNLTNIAIPDSVTSIGSCAFAGCCSLTSIVIPNSVTSIGNQAFEECNGLTIYAEAAAKPSGWDSNWNYSNCPVVWDYKNNDVADDGYIYTIQNGLRYGIKDGAAMVAKQPSNIREANIASEIIYKDTRYSVTSIGSSAFFDCSRLTSIAIPDSVTSIGDKAFLVCGNLTSITYQGTKAEWKAITKESGWNDYTGNYTVTCTDGTLTKSEA